MNAFYEHHQDSIRFGDRCFDRILLNGLIQPFQQPERVIGFFRTYRHQYPVSRDLLRDIATQVQTWVTNHARSWGVPLLDAPDARRDEFVERYFRRAQPDEVVVILTAREPARILIAIGNKPADRWHLTLAQRWVNQYNVYVNDRDWGRVFVRICPCFPLLGPMCLNQHHWLARRMLIEGITFRQCANAFLGCSDPARRQALADSLTARGLRACGDKWLTRLTPFFTRQKRTDGHCRRRLFFSQVEYCDNLIFDRRAALDRLAERLLEANRTIGRCTKLTVIFGRKVTPRYRGKLQTVIEALEEPNPVIRSHRGHGFVKQYVRDDLLLRTEPATNNVTDYGVPKAIEHLPHLRDKLGMIVDNYLRVPQDILETFLDRGQLRQLAAPTILPNWPTHSGPEARSPAPTRRDACRRALRPHRGRHVHHPRAASRCRRCAGCAADDYSPASLRCDLSELRAKGLVVKVPHSRRYRLQPQGYGICLVVLHLFERIYAPLTAGLLRPVAADSRLHDQKRHQLDRLYQRVVDDLDALIRAVGLKSAA